MKTNILFNQLIPSLVAKIHKGEGFTLSLNTFEVLSGPYYIVSLRGYEQKRVLREGNKYVYERNGFLSIENFLRQYINQYEGALSDPNNYLGAWFNDGYLYLDVSEAIHQRYKTLSTVKKIAKERGQLAIWDLSNNCSIEV